ncbi:hypothetical protein C4D60_Mb08t21460 [Musa balbisiana]|uniref:Glycosyltransferases n=1 Tax=Musa balbisiana TaxID=52838 RepID=A0A4S8K5E8_MUSBA|nr:hypothetical protein C4D60_Mb08t21460 [Musa balbisiana]
MGSLDRSKKRTQLWKKALLHFALCFVTGFFTGFAPTSTASLFSRHDASIRPATADSFNRSLMAEMPPETPAASERLGPATADSSVNRSLMVETTAETPAASERLERGSERQLIVVTTTQSGDRLQGALLRRLADTLKLVPPPLLWVVVQARAAAPETAEVLRRTGVVYRHLTFDANFTDPAAEADHQRNVALNHIEYHRLTGIVHFAGASNVYDLRFFQEMRQIEGFGAWPVALVSANRKRVVVEGPICNSSKVVGWLFRDLANDKIGLGNLLTDADMKAKHPRINISGFAFNSSILWDPERWGRATSVPDTSQDSIKFVREVLLEDETKLKGIPAGCSKIMLWHLHIPRATNLPSHHQIQNASR